jgi:serine/threonine-protein kinase 24/25/MST4
MVSEVIVPTIQLAIRDDMEAREIEALSMLSKGFEDLREANPELAYNLVLDILTGINECVFPSSRVLKTVGTDGWFCSNQAVRQHISTTRGLFPHRRIRRNTQMTSNGVVVIEQEDTDPTPDTSPSSPTTPDRPAVLKKRAESVRSGGSNGDKVPPSPDEKKSPISELLYMRWLEGLKLRWPNIL